MGQGRRDQGRKDHGTDGGSNATSGGNNHGSGLESSSRNSSIGGRCIYINIIERITGDRVRIIVLFFQKGAAHGIKIQKEICT